MLAEVAAELGLTRITASDAVQNLAAQIDQAIGDGTWLAREAWDRLRSAGTKWGLTGELVDELIHQRLAENRHDFARRSVWTNATLIGAGTAVIAACLLLGGLFANSARCSAIPLQGATNFAPAQPRLAKPPVRPPGGTLIWRSKSRHAKAKLGGFADVYRSLAAASTDRRSTGYQRLLDQVLSSPEDSAPVSRRRPHCRRLLCPGARGASGRANSQWPHGPVARRRSAVASQRGSASPVAVDGRYRDKRSPAARHRHPAVLPWPKHSMRRLATRFIPVPRPPSSSGSCDERTILASYQQFTAAAARQPKEVAVLYPALAEAAADVLSEDDFSRAETSLLVAALPASGDRWTAYERPLVPISSPDPLPALRLLEALRRATQPGLVERLSELLLVRAAPR